MKIPVFVSSPTVLTDKQKKAKKTIINQLIRLGLENRALGQSDYPTESPLHEVYVLSKHCAGGIILGFEQFRADSCIVKPNTKSEIKLSLPKSFPTPWNQLEAGILFSLGLPLLIFKEPGISGGIFDEGVTDVFIHQMPKPSMTLNEKRALEAVFLKWQAGVRKIYYQ